MNPFDSMMKHIEKMLPGQALEKLDELCDSYNGVNVSQDEKVKRVFLLSEVQQGHVTKFKFEKKTSWFSFNRFKIRWHRGTHKNEQYNFLENAKLLKALIARVSPDTLDEAQLKKFNTLIKDYNKIIESVAQKKEPGFFSRLFGRAEKKREECKEIRDQKIGELTKKINVSSQIQQPVQVQSKETSQKPPTVPRRQTPFPMPSDELVQTEQTKQTEEGRAPSKTFVQEPRKTTVQMSPDNIAEESAQESPQPEQRKQTVDVSVEGRTSSRTVVKEHEEQRKKTIIKEAQPQASDQVQAEQEIPRRSIARKPTVGVLVSEARTSASEELSKEQIHLLDILKGISESVSSWQKAMKGFVNTTGDIIQLKEELDRFAKDCDIFQLEDPINNQSGILDLQKTFKKFEENLPNRIPVFIEKLLGEIQKNKIVDSKLLKPLEDKIRTLLNKIELTDPQAALVSTISFWKEFNDLNAKSGQRERLKIEEYFIYTVLNAVHQLYDLESIYSTEDYGEATQKLTSLQKKGKNESQYEEYLEDLHSLQEDVLRRIGVAARKRQQWLSSIQNKPFDAFAKKVSEQLKGALVKGSIDRNALHDTIQEKFEIFLNASAQFEGLAKKLEAIEEHNIQQKIDRLLKDVEDPNLYPFGLNVGSIGDLSGRLKTFKDEVVSSIENPAKTKDPEEREEELRELETTYNDLYEEYQRIVRHALKIHFEKLKEKIPKGEGSREINQGIETIKIALNETLKKEELQEYIDKFKEMKEMLEELNK